MDIFVFFLLRLKAKGAKSSDDNNCLHTIQQFHRIPILLSTEDSHMQYKLSILTFLRNLDPSIDPINSMQVSCIHTHQMTQ